MNAVVDARRKRGREAPLLLALCISLISIACEVGPQSGRGLRLPDGDIVRGERAFLALGCGSCHYVAGTAVPERNPSDVTVMLGGVVTRVESYGELVTSIINPSHEISGWYPREQVARGEASKMENFNDQMTVAQLIDLTAFLQSRYELRKEPIYLP